MNQNKSAPRVFRFPIFLILFIFAGCSLRTASREDLSPTTETIPTTQAIAVPTENEALYLNAVRLMSQAAFGEAALKLEQYLAANTLAPNRGPALLNLALCQLHLDHSDAALQSTRTLLEDEAYFATKDIQVQARWIRAEAFLRKNRPAEALALTFELLPSRSTKSKPSGFDVRGNWSGKLEPLEIAKTLALRGRIYGDLGKTALAEAALARAVKALAKGPESERRALRAQVASYRIEIIEKTCAIQHPAPSPLSEREAIAYIEDYYACARAARAQYCEVKAHNDQAILSRSLISYRRLASAPLQLIRQLPPPARPVRPEERNHYEKELKAAIESWSEEKMKTFRNLDSCGAENIF
ncbi:MAG TPA: hypothetical protein PLH57_07155 [Oligoflexia bacterium]|nr:hypothetical protein [Oligoflexia bacterium]